MEWVKSDRLLDTKISCFKSIDMDTLRAFYFLNNWHMATCVLLIVVTACSLIFVFLFRLGCGQKKPPKDRNCIQKLLSVLPDIAWMKDGGGVIVACNSALAERYSWRIEDIIGKSDYDLFDKDTADLFRKGDLLAIAAGKPYRREEQLTTKNGERRYFETTASPMYDQNRVLIGVLGIARDITERKATEEALRSSEKRFSAAFQLSPIPMVISLSEDGTIIDANDTFLTLCGYTKEELVGLDRQKLGIWMDNTQFAECYRQLKACGSVRDFDTAVRSRHGRVFHSLTSANLIEIDSKEHILWGGRDVTEQRLAEQKLRNSQQKFYAIFHMSPNALVLVDESDGRSVEVNDAFAKLVGFSRDELLGKTGVGTDLMMDRYTSHKLIEKVKECGVLYNAEVVLTTKNGIRRTCEISATKVFAANKNSILWSFQDITEKREAENALRASEEKFSAAFRASPDAVVITRTADGVIVDLNESMSRMSGYSREELLGRTHIELGFWVNREEREALVAEILEHGRVRDQEVNMRTKDGAILFFLISAEVFSIEGEPHTLSVIHDITRWHLAEIEIKNANERLTALSAQLIDAQETERRILANELHDEIGQSLTVQKMALEALYLQSKDPTLCARIDTICEINDRVLNQVRPLSLNLRPPQLDDLGLVAAIRWNVSQQSSVTDCVSHFSARREIPDKLPESIAIACYRIVQEALNNALKHSEANNVWVSLQAIAGRLQISVRDDGKGFAPKNHNYLKSIGVAGMTERAQMIGGTLTVVSQPGMGCTITADIPLPHLDAPCVT